VADWTLGDVPVLAGTITLPLAGRWIAELVLDTPAVVAGTQTLATADGAIRAVGTVRRGGGYAERGHVSLVGGADGLARPLGHRFYRDFPARVVATDLLRECGESLSPASAAVLDRTLPAWARRAGTASDALEALCAALGATWRVDLAGRVWIGPETWPAFALAAEPTEEDPAAETITLALDTPPAGLVPGVALGGRRVVGVTHTLGARARTLVQFDAAGLDPYFGPAAEIARAATRDREYHAPIPAAVVSQGADGTLDVLLEPDLPDDQRVWPPMTELPLRSLGPGITVQVAAGARVLVQFEHGDPTRPVATLFDAGAGNITGLKLGAGATKGVARAQDPVRTPITVTVGNSGGIAAVSLAWTDEDGAPQTLALSFTGSATLNGSTTTPPTPTTLGGSVKVGSAKILAED
jgi:hypothetical protein